MNCVTATEVYKSSNPLAKIEELFPQAWEFFNNQLNSFIKKEDDIFDTEVKKIVGDLDLDFRIVHRDDVDNLTVQIQELLGDITSRLLIEEYFTNLVKRPIYFNTFCCSGCMISDKPISLRKAKIIQEAAISLQNN
jgi:hypothetical protein